MSKLTAASLEKELTKALSNAMSKAEAVAKANAPVDTGQLRNSIEGTSSGLEGLLLAKAPYAAHVEFGTRYQRAQPFMFPALLALEVELEKEVKEALRRWKR